MRKFFKKGKNPSKDSLSSGNPYEQPSVANDPYSKQPIQPANPAYNTNNSTPPLGASGYSAGTYGSTGGYGSKRYDNNDTRARPGGYGGLGDPKDESENLLFAGRNPNSLSDNSNNNNSNNRYAIEDRFKQPSPSENRYAASSYSGTTAIPGSTNSSAYAPSSYGAPPSENGGPESTVGEGTYGGYGGQRELTAEEKEELEYRNTKNKVINTLDDSVASTQRSLQAAYQALEMGANTLDELNAQTDMLNNTERKMDQAKVYNKIADDRARELQRVNGNMFAVVFQNKSRQDAKLVERQRALFSEEKADRDATLDSHHVYQRKVQEAMRANNKDSFAKSPSKFDFDWDDEDKEFQEGAAAREAQINANTNQISAVVGQLNSLAKAQGAAIDSHIDQIDRIMEKNDGVQAHVRLNTERLRNIR